MNDKTWHPVARVNEIDDEDFITLEVQDTLIAVVNLGGEFFATSGLCTHQDEPLTDGLVMDGILECPFHQGRFCVRTGKVEGAPASEDLATYPVRVENGQVFVAL